MSKEVKQMVRGFQVVNDKHRKNKDIFTNEKGVKFEFNKDIKLPVRADKGSSGYDFYLAKDTQFLPNHVTKVYTDVKAYMQQDEELLIFIRSSLAINHGLKLVNQIGKIDSSYYNNPKNDGNIILAIENTSGRAVTIKEGERIAQGSFYKYLLADEDKVLHDERTGGIGSSGK